MKAREQKRGETGALGHSTPGPTRPAGAGGGGAGKAAGTAACPAAEGPAHRQRRDGDTRQRPGWLRMQGKGQCAAARRDSPPRTRARVHTNTYVRAHTHSAKKAVSAGPPPLPTLTRCLRLSRRAAGSSPCWGAGPTPHSGRGRRRLPPGRPGLASLHGRWRGGGHHAAGCQHRPQSACAAHRHRVT